MTSALILLLLVATAALYGRLMTNMIRNDGYGRISNGHTPPRSHVPDLFDPTRTA